LVNKKIKYTFFLNTKKKYKTVLFCSVPEPLCPHTNCFSLSLSLWEGGLLLFFFFPFLSFLEVCVDCGIHKVNIFIALHQFYTWSSYQLQWKEFNFLVFLLIHIPAMENSEFCSSQFMSSSCCSQHTLVLLALALFITKDCSSVLFHNLPSSHCFGVTICGSSSI